VRDGLAVGLRLPSFGTIQQDANAGPELLIGEGLREHFNARVKPSLVHDGVSRISGREQYLLYLLSNPDVAGERADRLHLLRLTQRFLRLHPRLVFSLQLAGALFRALLQGFGKGPEMRQVPLALGHVYIDADTVIGARSVPDWIFYDESGRPQGVAMKFKTNLGRPWTEHIRACARPG
jgi:hypothetical protein